MSQVHLDNWFYLCFYSCPYVLVDQILYVHRAKNIWRLDLDTEWWLSHDHQHNEYLKRQIPLHVYRYFAIVNCHVLFMVTERLDLEVEFDPTPNTHTHLSPNHVGLKESSKMPCLGLCCPP